MNGVKAPGEELFRRGFYLLVHNFQPTAAMPASVYQMAPYPMEKKLNTSLAFAR